MSWDYPTANYTEYSRNPLVSTDIEVRYHPVLEVIEDISKTAALQEQLREEFPRYKRVSSRVISIPKDGSYNVNIVDENQHVFSNENETISLVLGSESLRISSIDHKNKNEAISGIMFGYRALLKVYGSISLRRLGVRYVNVINKSDIAKDLGLENDSLAWPDVVDKSFFNSPNDIADLFDSTFMNQINSNHKNGGGLVLRYGLVESGSSIPITFRFDIDRYIEGELNTKSLEDLIDGFALDIYSLFHSAVGSKLKIWMSQED